MSESGSEPPPPKNMGVSAPVFACEKKWQVCVIFVHKNDSHLSFLDLKKMTGACHFWNWQKWQSSVQKMTGVCHFWILRKWQMLVIFGIKKVSCGWHFPNIIFVKKRQLTCFRMTKAVPRQKGLPRGVKVCKSHYKYAKISHNFGFKKGFLKRIFLIIYRYDYYNE